MTAPHADKPASDPFIGRTVLGRFEVLRPLARGGMGVLYLARTRGAQGFVRPVVIKRVGLNATADSVQMFVREAHVMASLHHPNIVQAIDFNQEGDEYLLVMEYVEGYSLARWAKFVREAGRPFDVQFAVQVVLAVLEALAHAHALTGADGSPAAVIHRDVTPSNVMVSTEGHVKLLDFGIARLEHERTAQGPEGPTIKGKFAYLAPEIIAGEQPSTSSDVYAAALMLHELVLGRNEFAADDLSTTLVNVARKRPARLDQARADVAPAIAAVIERALEKEPEKRYATAAALAAALRQARGEDGQRVQERMVAQIREDFFAPAMLTAMQGFDVQTLAKAWQSDSAIVAARATIHTEQQRTLTEALPNARPLDGGTAVAPANYAAIVAYSRPSAPEIATTGPDRTRPTVAPKRRKGEEGAEGSKSSSLVWAAWAAAVAALAALGAAGLVLYRSQGASGQGFVVIEGQGSQPAVEASVAERRSPQTPRGPDPLSDDTSDAGAMMTSDAQARTVRAPSNAGPLDEEQRLTGQFARHRPRIEACARRFSEEASQSRIEGVRLSIDRSGAVRAASLLPAEADSTALGQCVLGVARAARFEPSPNGLTFRLPLSLRLAPR